MEQLIEIHGKPLAIRCDNGAELTSYDFTEWRQIKGIAIRFIQPGKPDQNAFIERFNRTYREEVLTPYCSTRSRTCARSPTSGSSDTTRSDRTTRWEACRQRATASDCSPRKTPLLNCLLDGKLTLSLERQGWEKFSTLHESDRCTGCKSCEATCPFSAISMHVGVEHRTAPSSRGVAACAVPLCL